MGPKPLFGKTLTMLERALDLRSRHHNRLVSNVVNIDTPNYKAFDTAIDEALARLERPGTPTRLERTHPAHLGRGEAAGSETLPGRSVSHRTHSQRTDRNTVDLERSMAELSENQIVYNSLAQIVGRKFAGLKSAIRGE